MKSSEGVSRKCGKVGRCPEWGTETDATDKTDWGGEVHDTHNAHENAMQTGCLKCKDW